MFLRGWRFVTILLAALALTMTSAHVLELPVKMQYDAGLYAAVNTTLYRHFATVGAVYTIGSIVAAFALAYLCRGRRPAFGWTLAGGACLLLAFGTWLALVAPVNREVADALRSAPESVPAVWMRLRPRWEYGHAVGFVLGLAGFGALLASVLAETPGRRLATGERWVTSDRTRSDLVA
ncbi:MAG: anthrone oxygenase family protein [Candidatus Rokuibacteriota bacterium]